MPPTYSPFWKPFETLGRLALVRRRLDLGQQLLGPPSGSDVKGGLDWHRFRDPSTLYDLWGPPHSSPWSGYHRPTLFAALDSLKPAQVGPSGVPNLYAADAPMRAPHWVDGRTAILLDLPLGTSVAYAAFLCRRAGMAPVATFNNWPHQRGVVDATTVLAALLYYSPWAEEGWNAIAAPNEAPPVFMADSNRMGPAIVKPRDFDNRYYLMETDLPSAATMASRGIERLVYVRPETPTPPKHEDMDDLNGYLHETSKRIPVQLAKVALDTWRFGEPGRFDATVRKTPFSTTRDPAFRGFRRNAAGGFGVLVPEPGQGGGG